MSTPNAQQVLSYLQNPSVSLPALGKVHDQKTGQFMTYDPTRITEKLQVEILDYLSNTPRTTDGQTKFLTVLTARQMGKSLTSEYGCYPKAAFNPGWDHVCIADTGDRAEYLHKRVHHLHEQWPKKARSRTIPSRESRQLTFRQLEGGKMRILSAEAGAVGIGQSPDSFHASECPFWADFSGSMFLIWPSLMNRDNALVIFEATPWEARSDWHEHCAEASKGLGRHLYKFFPYWDGKLNSRPWAKTETLTHEEIDLLNRYGKHGLTQENLAFRRLMLDTDQQLRRKPELFDVFYPSDDISCWIVSTNAAIPGHALERHLEKEMTAWTGPYMEYEPPEEGAVYVIGADPSGHAARDHASFQVLKCYDGEWTQVATFAEHIDPLSFSRKLVDAGQRYNRANIVVESNGVGQGVLTLLRDWDYPNLFYEKKRRPGFTTTAKSLDQTIGYLIDALLDDLHLNDADTLHQFMSYKNDKRIEEGAGSEIARGEPNRRRRERHHWDKVSAMMMALVGARWAPRRQKPQYDEEGNNVIEFRNWSYDEKTQMAKGKKRAARTKYWI